MKKKISRREQEINNAISVLRSILKCYCSEMTVKSKEFIKKLHEYGFESKEQLNLALDAYCTIVLTRDVRNAVFIVLPENPPIETLNLQTSIARGMQYAYIVNEFIDHDQYVIPGWYLAALKKMNLALEDLGQFCQLEPP